MKRNKKHHFAHTDPESVIDKSEKRKLGEIPTKRVIATGDQGLIKKDLKRTIITIGIFILIVIAIYLVEQKTDLLKPVLTRFGL